MGRPVKESFYVRVPSPADGPVLFVDASGYIGRQLPYKEIQATCAMRVDQDAVSFSLLHIPKRLAKEAASKPPRMPRGAFRRLAEERAQLPEPPDQDHIWASVKLPGDQAITAKYRLWRDDNNVGRVEVVDGHGAGDEKDEDPVFELPVRAVEVSAHLHSPVVRRPISVSFVGHLGKPKNLSTLGRATSMALNSLSGLAEFRLLSKIEAMKVPAAPGAGRAWIARPKVPEVGVTIPVRLYSPEPDYWLVAAGEVAIRVDLEVANQATGRLLYHFRPSHEIAEAFDQYRGMADQALTDVLRQLLGDELELITYEVVLGEVTDGTAERLQEALSNIAGMDLTPNAYRTSWS